MEGLKKLPAYLKIAKGFYLKGIGSVAIATLPLPLGDLILSAKRTVVII